MLIAGFLSNAAANLIGDLVAGGLVAVGVYLVIERRLRLQQERANRAEIGRGILSALADELRYNIRVADTLLEHLPKGALLYSGFEMNGWTLVSQVPAIATLDPSTVKALLDAYLRLRSANEQHRLLFDFTYGGTGAISFLVAGTTTAPEGRAAFQRIEDQRVDLRERLLRRVEDLVPHLRVALDQVEHELETYAMGTA
jgi:hypothetical protein